jgi:Leucine-rich repeat (LRR) protein
LELIDTELEEFPVEALEELMVLQTLVLDRHRISNLSQPIRGLGSLKNLQISNGNISQFAKETFAGVGSKLVRLDLHGNQLSGVPKDAFQV